MNKCLAILFLGLLLILPAQAEELEIINGSLSNVMGDITVLKRGGKEWISAFDNMTVGMGDQVATGLDGEATLAFENSVTQIKPMTQFIVGRTAKVEEGTYTELFLQAGKVISDVTKAPKGERNRFNVITPVSVVGVRGTVQTVEYNPGVGQESNIRRGTGFMAKFPSEKLPDHVKVLLGIEPEPEAEQDAAPARKQRGGDKDEPEYIEVSDIKESKPRASLPAEPAEAGLPADEPAEASAAAGAVAVEPTESPVDDTAILAGVRDAWNDSPSWNAREFWKIGMEEKPADTESRAEPAKQ